MLRRGWLDNMDISSSAIQFNMSDSLIDNLNTPESVLLLFIVFQISVLIGIVLHNAFGGNFK